MLVVNPVIVAVRSLSAWPVVLVSAAIVALIVALPKKATKGVTPRKIHALGTSIPIIGDMLEDQKHLVMRHEWLAEQCQRFGFEPWGIRIPGTPPMVVVADPAVVQTVMVSQVDNFVKGSKHREILHDLLGDGIVNLDGEAWHSQRKTAAKFFSAHTLRLCMMQTMQRSMNQVYAVLDAACETGASTNLGKLFLQFTLQTFLEVGVGVESPIIGASEPAVFDALDDAVGIIMRRRLMPRFMWKLQRWLNVGSERKVKECMDGVKAYILGLVEQSLGKQNSAIPLGASSPGLQEDGKIRTAIDLFVEHSSEDKVGLHPRDLVDFALNFVIAARDTSSVATQWFFYQLGQHPDVEAKIRAELAATLPSLGVSRDGYITAEHVKQLVYLEATIKETLRLSPAAPFMVRQARQDTVIDGDLFIRKGQAVGMSVYAMARNPRVWGPDAAEFKPERWIDAATGTLLSVPATKFFTFSAGPRVCIGMNLAMINLRVLTANLLHRYKFRIDARNDGSHVNAIVLQMKDDLLATVERI